MPRGAAARTPLESALIADPSLVERLYAFARARAPDAATAQDLVSETLRAALQREREGDPWDPSGRRDALIHLASVLDGVRANHRRAAKRRPLERTSDPDVAAGAVPDPEQALVERDRALERARLVEEVRARLAQDENGTVPLAMLEAADRGVRGHGELAKAIGCTLEDVRRGQRRIAYHAERIVKKAVEGAGGEAA